jgi:hypothetical protein
MKIHDTFHTFLLRIAATNSLIDQIQSSSSSIVMKDEEEEYEVNDILNSLALGLGFGQKFKPDPRVGQIRQPNPRVGQPVTYNFLGFGQKSFSKPES